MKSVQVDSINKFLPDIDQDKYTVGVRSVEGDKELIDKSMSNVVGKIRVYLTENYPSIFENTLSDNSARSKIGILIEEYIKKHGITIEGVVGLSMTIRAIKSEILDYGVITEYIESDRVEEIRINSYRDIRIVIAGKEYKTSKRFSDLDTCINIAKKIIRTVGKNISSTTPIVDARLSNGQRVACIIGPLSLSGINLTIRKQRREIFTADKLIECGSMNEKMMRFLDMIGDSEISCMIVGPTNSGKTATLQCLINRLVKRDRDRRIITIEDTAELNLSSVNAWETRNGYDLLDLFIHALRQSPETLVLGEMRGREAQTVVAAANTGHQVYNTFHASGPGQAPIRILQMYMMGKTNLTQDMILDMIVEAFPICIYQRKMKDGSRKIISISEMVDIVDKKIIYSDVFIYNGLQNERHVFNAPITKKLRDKLVNSGIDIKRVKEFE